MIKFSIVVGVLNNPELARTTLKMMLGNLSRSEETELIVIDNGSDVPFTLDGMEMPGSAEIRIVRNEVNSGNYPLFFQANEIAKGEIIAFMHSDVFVYQKGWDESVRAQFEIRNKMGLLGFIGSTQLDAHGGRGLGTVSNMQGRMTMEATTVQNAALETRKSWSGSRGDVHGKQDAGMTVDGSVVDGCVMIFRKSVFDQIEFKPQYACHHFYDRLMSCQVIELGYTIGILGVEFDHVSGQTANTQQKWQDTSAAWFKINLGIDTPQEWAKVREDWVQRGRMNPSAGKVPDQWDYAAYLEGEYQFLKEYRDEKHLVPLHMGKRV